MMMEPVEDVDVEEHGIDECNAYPHEPDQSPCAIWWEQKGNKPNYLLSMAVGLTDGSAERPCDDDDRLLPDFTQEPYVSLSQNSSYNPRQKVLAKEIYRRDRIQRATDPSRKKNKAVACNSWVKEQCF